MKKLLLLVLFGLLLASPSLAADIYISETGNDTTGDGSATAPYASFTQAFSVGSGGDNYYCQGTIVENVSIPASMSGTADNYMLIQPREGYTCTLDANQNDVVNYAIYFQGSANYININGLNITNSNLYGIYSNDGNQYIQITNNTFSGFVEETGNNYIYVDDMDDSLISGNTLYGNNAIEDNGIWISNCDRAVIEKNRVYNFIEAGIIVDHVSNNSLVRNNWIYNVAQANIGTLDHAAGIVVNDTMYVEVYNNSIYGRNQSATTSTGIKVDYNYYGTQDVTLRNNIISNVDYGITIDTESLTNFTSNYNDFYETTYVGQYAGTNATSLANWQTFSSQDANSLDSDPSFINTTSGSEDLHLQSGSAMIDAGTDLSNVTEDWDAETRPYNVTDMGADELPSPIVPTDFTVSNLKAKSATLSWTGNTTATSYTLQYDTTEVPDLTEASYSFTGLDPNTTYDYQVRVIYTTDYATYQSDYSTADSFVTLPQKATNLRTTKRKAKSAVLRWAGTADHFKVKIETKKGKKIRVFNNVTKKKKKITKKKIKKKKKKKLFKVNKAFRFKVKACNSVDQCAKWVNKKFRTKPAKVKKVRFNEANNILRWKKVRGKKITYLVKLMNKKKKKIKILKTKKKRKIINNTKTKYIKVRAKFNKKNKGKWSKVIKI